MDFFLGVQLHFTIDLCSWIKMEADIEAFSISIFHLYNSRLFKVLPYNGLTNKRTDYSAHKAE